MTHREGSDSGLARVTYLPGATPPSEPSLSQPVLPTPVTPAPVLPTPLQSGTPVPAGVTDEQSRALEKLSHAVRLIEEKSVDSKPVAFRGASVRGANADDSAVSVDSGVAADVEVAAETEGERSARAHNVSMHALTRRGMSSREMTDLLTSRGLEPHDVSVEVESLERVGLLDDVELASTLVRTLTERKGLGRTAITSELRRRKVDASAIEFALEALDGDDELVRATEVALKRAPQLRSLDSETAKRRLGAFLMRKGYGGSVVSKAVQTALSSHAPTSTGPRFR